MVVSDSRGEGKEKQVDSGKCISLCILWDREIIKGPLEREVHPTWHNCFHTKLEQEQTENNMDRVSIVISYPCKTGWVL